MNVAKTMFAFIIAVSVVLLPAVRGMAFAVTPKTFVESTLEGMDCCPAKASPCEKAMDGCTSMATCVLSCFSFAGISYFELTYPVAPALGIPLPRAGFFNGPAGIPPFRPPRV